MLTENEKILVDALAMEKREIDATIKKLENRLAEIESEFVRIMNGREKIETDTFKIIHKMIIENRFDQTLFKTENPGIYEQYKKPNEKKYYRVI